LTFYDPHLDHRKAQEQAHIFDADPMTSLVTVELNITELCNRKCVFCPRVDPKIYPNQNLHMHEGTVASVASELNRLGSRARISFSGFGEPLLHPRFAELIATARLYTTNTIECNTNGDKLTPQKIKTLFEAGLSWLYVNMYDGPEQEGPFKEMFKEAGISRFKLRPHWIESHGLTLNNRSGMVKNVSDGVSGRCHYPFYKMLVDWNGDVQFCSNDWGRKIKVGNVLTQGLKEIWLSEQMKEIRLALSKGDRSRDPCNACSVVGTLSGKPSHDLLMEHYNS
jgi:radical SAM protein with 4Fe4S-binding SPASM domain